MATYRSKSQKYNVILSLAKTARASRQDPAKIKRELFIKFSKLGGIYVKFLQLLALSDQFMADWGGADEMNVFENVPYDKINIQGLLKSELGSKVEHITHITPEPVASGSFAQVYRAILSGGDDVIIKVLKPSVVENLNSDLKFIAMIARVIDTRFSNSAFKYRDVVKDLRKTAMHEIDYHTEVSNIEWFGQYFKNDSQIVIPKVYRELCTNKVIIEEYIEGISLATAMQAQAEGADIEKFVKDHTNGSDIWEQAYILGRSFLLSTLNSKYVFGDPHPGNIILLPDNKIALIDFGIIVRPPKDTSYMYQLIHEYFNMYDGKFNAGPFTIAFIGLFDSKLMQALQVFTKANFPNSRNKLNDVLESAVNNVMIEETGSKVTQDILSDMRIVRLFNRVINKDNRFGIHINPAATQLHKAMMVFASMVATIGSKYPNKPHMLATKRGLEYALEKVSDSSASTDNIKMSVEEATERVMGWLAEIAVKDPMLYKQLAKMAGR